MSVSKKQKRINSYKGYVINKDDEIEVLEETPTAEEFWNKFIKLRKPVKFAKQDVLDLEKFKAKNICDFLQYDSDLQVERKYNYGFGGGQSREKLLLNKILKQFEKGDGSYYLTTQYDFDDPTFESEEEEDEDSEEGEGEDNDDSEEDEGAGFGNAFSDTSSMASLDMNDLHDDFDEEELDENKEDAIENESESESENLNDGVASREELQSRLRELLQPPLTNLYGKIPIVPELFKTLVPQQVNLWMGYTDPVVDLKEKLPSLDKTKKNLGLGRYIPSGGTSSGLHHDHADNLYVLIQGRKRFTLISPLDAEKLLTVGTIYLIFENGIIDYDEDERAPDWSHVRDDGALVSDVLKWRLDTDESLSKESRDAILQTLKASKIARKTKTVLKGLKVDPPSFSTVPPSLLHLEEIGNSEYRERLIKFADKYFPGLLDMNKMVVELKPGEMLYLPCGWFHEVSSFGIEEAGEPLDHVHIAVNYWMVPPNNLEDMNRCYKDGYYSQDWEQTKKCLQQYFRE